MKKTRILYCEGNTDGTIGGSFFSLLFLCQGLDRREFEPIVVFRSDNSLRDRFRTAGIETVVVQLPEPFHFRILDRKQGKAWRTVLLPFRLIQRLVNFFRFFVVGSIKNMQRIRTWEIDIVHLNNSIIRNHDWMAAALLAGRPCITHERGINNRYPLLARFFAKRIDAVICISRAVEETLERHRVRVRRSIVIYNGLDHAMIRPDMDADDVKRRLGIASGRPVIGMIGNIKEWKGQESVVRAVAQLRKDFPDLACVLVGDTAAGDRYYESRLRKIVEQDGLSENVIFAGYERNVANMLNIFDVVIHASVAPEPFGRVLLEAMAMRKAQVGARAGAVPEIIDEGKTGYLFSPGDSVELAERVRLLLENPTVARELGVAGYDRLKSQFDIGFNVGKTVSLYHELV